MNKAINKGRDFWKNVLSGFSVSFFVLSLGAVFGVISGRGVFIGMLSAVVITLITSVTSGTKVQASSPTGPMAASLIAVMSETKFISIEGFTNDQFVNFALIFSGLILLVAGLLKIDRLIKYVPNIVISGFMTGIGILIAHKELKILFGWQGTEQIQGNLTLNLIITILVLILGFLIVFFLNKSKKEFVRFIPPILLVIIIATFGVFLLGLDSKIQLVDVGANGFSFENLKSLVGDQMPPFISFEVIKKSLPYAIKFAVIAYLDTLMTALVIENKLKKKANHSFDLYAQGLASSLIGLFGGVPGAQSTVPSIMLLNEGATKRIATISLGIFTLLGFLFLLDFISLIPEAVFVGVLLKIAYDVADFKPFEMFFRRKNVNYFQLMFILIVAFSTAFWSLNIAVIGGTLVFWALKGMNKKYSLRDLKLEEESEGYLDEV